MALSGGYPLLIHVGGGGMSINQFLSALKEKGISFKNGHSALIRTKDNLCPIMALYHATSKEHPYWGNTRMYEAGALLGMSFNTIQTIVWAADSTVSREALREKLLAL